MSSSAHAYLAYVVDTIVQPYRETKYHPDTGIVMTFNVERVMIPGTGLAIYEEGTYDALRRLPVKLNMYGYREYRTVEKSPYSAEPFRVTTKEAKGRIGAGYTDPDYSQGYDNRQPPVITPEGMIERQARIDAAFDLLGVPAEGRRWLLMAEIH